MQGGEKAALILDDGSRFEGYMFGHECPVAGEVVFNTAMTGYNESLTDPSFYGQMVVSTYPQIGNYGVPSQEKDEHGIPLWLESDRIHMKAIIVSDYSSNYSHWNSIESLGDYLKREKVVGLTGIDTRALAKHLREKGTMKGKIVMAGMSDIPFDSSEEINCMDEVSTKEVITYGSGSKRVVLLDCGVKANIIRQLIRPESTLIRVPWDYDFNTIDFDGLFLSNGPGDPTKYGALVERIQTAFSYEKPIYGICMGNQLLSLAAGAMVYGLKYGHHSHNQPVREVGSNRCFITSQNHGYAVDPGTLDKDWQESFVNLNDGTNEGVCHKTKPFFSVQFHPEANGGPTDTMFIFDEFFKAIHQ